jgi:hypothetical protein
MSNEKCPQCFGHGYIEVTEPDCCGQVYETGFCCDNPVPIQVQEHCSMCGGRGLIEQEIKETP